MLVHFKDGKDQAEDIVDEVVQKVLVALVDLDRGLVRRAERSMGEVKDLKVQRLFRI